MTVNAYGRFADSSLEEFRDHVSVYYGPEGVGKWTTAEARAEKLDILDGNVYRIWRTSETDFEHLTNFVHKALGRRMVIVLITESSTVEERAQLGLLAIDAPISCYFTFISSGTSLHNRIRAAATRTHFFGWLEADDIERILVEKRGFSPDRAKELAASADGRVSTALDHAKVSRATGNVRNVLNAITSRNLDQLEDLGETWTQEDTDLLVSWCYESITGRWRIFGPEDAVENKTLPLNILTALARKVRPRLVVRSQLMAIAKGA